MKSLRILAAAALISGSLRASEPKAPPPPVARPVAAPAALAATLKPDLRISLVPTNGIGPVYDFVIENVGNLPAKESTIHFWAWPPCPGAMLAASVDPGKLFKSEPLRALPVTTHPSNAFHYSVQMPEGYRGCRLRTVVDANHVIDELREDNNEASVQTAPRPRPDLEAWVTQSSPDAWRGTILITNKGNAPSPPCVLMAYCNAQKVNVGAGDAWPCGGNGPSRTWTFDVPRLEPGKRFEMQTPVQVKWLSIRVDTVNQVDESDEKNNTWPR